MGEGEHSPSLCGFMSSSIGELEQSQNRLGRLRRQSQGGDSQGLTGLQHEHVGAFFVHVRSVSFRLRVQGVDHLGGEGETCRNNGQVAGERFGLNTECVGSRFGRVMAV